MKHFVRALAVVLVLTGAAATTMTSNASATTKIGIGKTSAWPQPNCDPSNPNCTMSGN
jgi:hypothetical protein